jgi:hypothetical protein
MSVDVNVCECECGCELDNERYANSVKLESTTWCKVNNSVV